MLDHATTALELLAVALLVLTAGWSVRVAVPGPMGWPAAFAASAVVAVVASRVLLWLAARGERA